MENGPDENNADDCNDLEVRESPQNTLDTEDPAEPQTVGSTKTTEPDPEVDKPEPDCETRTPELPVTTSLERDKPRVGRLRDGPESWIATLIISEMVTALIVGSIFLIATFYIERDRQELSEGLEDLRQERAERLENLRFVRSSIAAPKADGARQFGGLDLVGTNLAGLDLSGANFNGADLSGTDLSRADLSGADLSGADLTGANLYGIDLTDANLTRATLIEVRFEATTPEQFNLLEIYDGTDFSQARLTDVVFSGGSFIGASFSGADLAGVDFIGANLTEADFQRADLTGADLSSADLNDAILTNTILRKSNLVGADLTGTCVASFSPLLEQPVWPEGFDTPVLPVCVGTRGF